MKRLLILCAGWPFLIEAQEVNPVLSPDYQALIRKDSATANKRRLIDSTHDMRQAVLRYKDYYYNNLSFRKIHANKKNELVFTPLRQRSLLFGGNATVIMGMQQPAKGPATQKEFVQGRSVGGKLLWQGPETGELLCFGPSIHSMVYDGSSYVYDINGRLIPTADAGDGNYQKAAPYNNSILRTGAYVSNAIALFARYKNNYRDIITTSFRAGQSKEQTIIRGNDNKANDFSVTIDGKPNNNFSLTGIYSFRQEKADHSNRAGFLSRAYQSSLTTPVSFSNNQGLRINGAQRSYSPSADNALFLLDNDDHLFRQQQHMAGFTADYRFSRVKVKLLQSAEIRSERSHEGYQPGTAGFAAGMPFSRIATHRSYTLNPSASFDFQFGEYNRQRGLVYLNYICNSSSTSIDYPFSHKDHRYTRFRQEASMAVSSFFTLDQLTGGIQLSNNFYCSNTSNKNAFFLPGIAIHAQQYRIFGIQQLWGKVFFSYNRYNSELPLSSSFAGYSLLRYNAGETRQYLPSDEVISYKNVNPVRHGEFNAGIEISFYNRYRFSGNWYSKETVDDIIPLFIPAAGFELNNAASYRNRGIELQFSNEPWIFKTKKFGIGNTISFVRNRNKVTAVQPGYNNIPVAGFRDVYKTLVKGQPLGVISGSRWLRNEANEMIIGADGFPLVNPTPGIIGDPTPDFTVKLNQYFSFKERWSLSIDWQWNKGGDIWNGTAAMLDYLGRSAGSAEQRGITGYVFNGVQAGGGHNTIPVSFYNAAAPVEQNRWVRYGPSGVAESYIQPADCIRIQNISITYKPLMRKKIKELAFSINAGNILLWSAYKGADISQLTYNIPGTAGLDFFNLPAVRSFSISSSIQF